ncbi:hypothetical protein ACFL4H_00205 [Candidatus Neomarinimicrobiota bacterium]
MDKLTEKYSLILQESEIVKVNAIKTILFLELKRDCSLEESKQELLDLDPFLKKDLIDSVTFVETPNKYRIK